MKKYYLILLIALALSITTTAQNANDKGIMYFSAEIENPNSDSLVIMEYDNYNIVKTFYLNDGIVEKSSFEIEKGYYLIDDGREQTRCFLKPGCNINLFINTENFDESIKYSGEGAAENNYIAKALLFEESFGEDYLSAFYAQYKEEKFLRLTDSLFGEKFNFLDNHKAELENDFVIIEYAFIQINYLDNIVSYGYVHEYFAEEENFKVSENFPDPYEGFDFSNEYYMYIPSYVNFVDNYIQEATAERCLEDSSLSFHREHLDIIDALTANDLLKEKLAEMYIKYYLPSVSKDDKDYCFKAIKRLLHDDANIIYVEKMEQKFTELEIGSPSPTFELFDIDSNLVKLEDFKGKYVFIDIWATWCKPCMAEIPYLDTLQEYFEGQDIAFVSMCVNDTKANWEGIIEKANLKGIQLFVPEPDNDFISSYVVNGIPRFILIDKNGLIVDADAKRPSNPALKTQLEELLKKQPTKKGC